MLPYFGQLLDGGGDPYFNKVTFLSHFETLVDVKGHTLIPSGSASLSATQKKFGANSLLLPGGSSDYLVGPSSPGWAFGNESFTMEGWVYLSAIGATARTLLGNISSGTDEDAFRLWIDGTMGNVMRFRTWNTDLCNGEAGWSTGVWQHFAITFDGSSYRLFKDGALDATQGDVTRNLSRVNSLHVGATGLALSQFPLNGYMDDVRITKGVCRYMAAFSPPALPYHDF